MADVVIENPIINSPFREPDRHFKFDDDGITNEIIEKRRTSTYFVPIPKPKKKGKQLSLEQDWTQDRVVENDLVNRIRPKIKQWRDGGYAGVTPTTRRLLEHWSDPERENKLFFCQIEALETAIYLAECASKFGDGWMADRLREENDKSNPGLPRLALKMATGSGKTVVMGMLIAWQALNKIANRQDARFSDTFVLIAPGITIRDRLRVLLPNDSSNYYDMRDLVPNDMKERLGQATILITNFHAFGLRETVKLPKMTKKMVNPHDENQFKENPDQMVRRVCRELGSKKNIIVINDEAHHCYRRKPDEDLGDLKGEDKKEAAKRNEEARLWISGVEAMQKKLGVKAIYDLSATPFFLRGSGFPEATLFPWVVSDFSLIDAIESGIVKVPRVPVSDNAMDGEMPTYRDLWLRIRDDLPKKGRSNEEVTGEPILPLELQGALHSLYENYKKKYESWANREDKTRDVSPPVFIVVCNTTNVSKLVYEYVAGWEKTISEPSPPGRGQGEGVHKVLVPGALPLFNDVQDGKWRKSRLTFLCDSAQFESGEALTDEFKKVAAGEIAEFKREYQQRYPGRDTDKLTDEDILREVMNTVGKPGKLGESIRCVVSVSMLTEGWDVNTVTHILGIRAFGTQLLCEQVVGRGLRRTSYVADDDGFFIPEYAEVYGVPFSFIPCSGGTVDPPKPKSITRVRAIPDRAHLEIRFPRVVGYKPEIPAGRLHAEFNDDSKLILSPQDTATKTEVKGMVGEVEIHTLDDYRKYREQEIAFHLAKETLKNYFREGDECEPFELFPQLLRISRQWLAECVVLKDDMFKQLVMMDKYRLAASEKIYRAVSRTPEGETIIKPILRPYDTMGSTQYVDFNTSKVTYQTDPDKCPISHVAEDSGWETKMAQTLESMPEVISYVKNQNLGFTIPYTIEGEQRQYFPDFLVTARLPSPSTGEGAQRADEGAPQTLTLIIEVTGEKKKDKAVKVETAQTLWIPAVNAHGGLGRWAFAEIQDPWHCMDEIRAAIT